MFDWLRYFPLELGFRKSQVFVTPRGPNFAFTRTQHWVIGDSRFYLRAPASRSVFGFGRYGRGAASRSAWFDLLEEFPRSDFGSFMPNERWQQLHFYTRQWNFVGPWFSGGKGFISMSARVIGQRERTDYRCASFFHPRVFETVVADFLSSFYGHDKYGKKARYRGPMNWLLLNISPSIQAANFEIHETDHGCDISRHVMFPVAHDRFIWVKFEYSGVSLLRSSFDTTPLLNLTQSIINSFRLEVGPTMQAQWDEVKATCPDMSLSPEFAELKWPIKPEDVGKAQALAPEVEQARVLPAKS